MTAAARLARPAAREAAPADEAIPPEACPQSLPDTRQARVFIDDCACLPFVVRLLLWATRNAR